MSFSCYPNYKDSGVEWLGDVPEHWDLSSLGVLSASIQTGPFGSQLHSEDYVDDGIPVVNPSNIKDGQIVPDWSCTVTEDIALRLCQHKLVPGDIVFARRGEMGRCALVSQNEAGWLCGTGSLNVRLSDRALPSFVSLFLGTTHVRELLKLESVGSTMDNLNTDILSRVYVPVPTIYEQTQIAAFLDRETAKIDALIAEQQCLIELLKEKRQAVISHAVTKGLNPDAPMKDSGIEWLGEVPAHWEVMALSKVTLSRCDGPFGSGLKSEHYTESGVRVIRLQNIRRDGFSGSDEAFIDAEYCESELSGHDVMCGDVLIAGLGDDKNTVGRACVAPMGIEPAMVKADCFRFRLDTVKVLPDYVAIQLSASSAPDAGVLSSGSTRSRIPLSVMATRKLAIPPVLEQGEITDFIRTEIAKLDTLTTEAYRAISLLQERRTALISAAVTGQIDVRCAEAA
jgi:type I restriction enzyme S subunit